MTSTSLSEVLRSRFTTERQSRIEFGQNLAWVRLIGVDLLQVRPKDFTHLKRYLAQVQTDNLPLQNFRSAPPEIQEIVAEPHRAARNPQAQFTEMGDFELLVNFP
uniref:Protein-(Glutamine-N5) methyltransferase, release factor-specific n=1 Tax=Steinernema glaseri TaxID=37863 RepID=A0A1I7YGI8_9BILA